MASHSEGPPYTISFVETHSRLQHCSDPASEVHNTTPQSSDLATSSNAHHEITYSFQPQHCDLSRTHQPHSSLQYDSKPFYSELGTQSTSTREAATSPLRRIHEDSSFDIHEVPRDLDASRTDYLRALTSIVLNHSAAKMSAQSFKTNSATPKKRAVNNSSTVQTSVPHYLQRGSPSFQGHKSPRGSLHAVTCRTATGTVIQNRSTSEKSIPTEPRLSSRDLAKTPPVPVQRSGEIATRNCELLKERSQLPSSEVSKISGNIYTKYEDDFPNKEPETLPVLSQCSVATIQKRCVQVQTLPFSLNVNEKFESSNTSKNEEKAQNVKRKKPRKTVIGKIGFSKSFFLSKKRVWRPETRRMKSIVPNTDQPSISSASTSGKVHESLSSKATSSWRDQSGDLDPTSSTKKQVTFSEDRGREVRLRRLRKRRRSKAVSGNAQIFKLQKAKTSTQVVETLNHLRYTGKRIKQCLAQPEKPLSSKPSPEELSSGLSQDERMVSSNPAQPLQTTIVNRCSLMPTQIYHYKNAGTATDPRFNVSTKCDMYSSHKISKHTDGGNKTAEANFMNVSRAPYCRSARNSVDMCKTKIKRLADATRCFLKYRKSFAALEKAQNLVTRGNSNASETTVNAPPDLPPDEESPVPGRSPAMSGKGGQRCDEKLSNIRQHTSEHSPAQTSRALGTPGPHGTTSVMVSTGKKHPAQYSSPKRRRDFNKYAPMLNSTKMATRISDKPRGSIATHQGKALSSVEVVEQWLHSSGASSQLGEPPGALASVEGRTTDPQSRPATRDIAVMATPRMMRQATLRGRRCNSKNKPPATQILPKKTKSRKVYVDSDHSDPNALRHREIDAHARCLEMLEHSSYSLTSDAAKHTIPRFEPKQSIRSKRKPHLLRSDPVSHRVLQERTPSFTPEQGTFLYKARHGQMFDTTQESTTNVKLRGNAYTNSKRLRFASTGPKLTPGRVNMTPLKSVERNATVVPNQGTCEIVERNVDSSIYSPINMQANALEMTVHPDISPQGLSNPSCSAGDPTSNIPMNEDEARQTNKGHEAVGEDQNYNKFPVQETKTSRQAVPSWPKKRTLYCKRLSGLPRRFRAPQWTDSSRKCTPSSHSREQCTASSEIYGLEQMGSDLKPNAIDNKETARENTESGLPNHISGTVKERMSKKLPRITHWNSNTRGSHSSVSSRKTEQSSYSDVSGSTFSDTAKANNCIPTRGFRTTVLVPGVAKSQEQEPVGTMLPSRDVPHLVVQCMGGTITPHPLPTSPYASSSLVTKSVEEKETEKQEENILAKGPPHMVLSISWGGTGCSLRCQKGESSENTQVFTLPPIPANMNENPMNTTILTPAGLGQLASDENDTKPRQKGPTGSPVKAKRADVSKCKGTPASQTGTPKMKQQASVTAASLGNFRRGTPPPNLAGNPKAKAGNLEAQSKKDKTAVEDKCSDSLPAVQARSLKQRSKPTRSVVKTPSSPCSKASPPSRKNVPQSRSVGPSRGQITQKTSERTGKDRKASGSEKINASVQVSRQNSASTTTPKKGLRDDKSDRKTSANRHKSAGTSPPNSSKLVEAYVQTSEEKPASCLESISGVNNYLQINPLGKNVTVSVQTSKTGVPEKADVSFQTSVSRMLILPKPGVNLTSAERWNPDFFTQTQRYLSNVACVLATQKKKALLRKEELIPKKSNPPTEVEIILPERKRREGSVRDKSQDSSSSSRDTSTADPSIQTPLTSGKRTPNTSSLLIQRTLRDAAHLLQRHRSLSAPQAPAPEKRQAKIIEACGMEGPPPWPVRSGPVRDCDTPSAIVTSDSSSSSSTLPPSESLSYKLSGNEKSRRSGSDASEPFLSSEKFKKSPSLTRKRSPCNASPCIKSACKTVSFFQNRDGSPSVVMNQRDKVVPQWRKVDLGNATTPKGRSTNPSPSPITSPTKGSHNKKQTINEPAKPSLTSPKKSTTSPPAVPSRSTTNSRQSSRLCNSMPKRLYQILQARSPTHQKPLVMRRPKKIGSKAPLRKARTTSVKASKQSAPHAETPATAASATAAAVMAATAAAKMAAAAARAHVRGEGPTSQVPHKSEGAPVPGTEEAEASPQPSSNKAPKAPDEKGSPPRGPASASHVLRGRSSTGMTAPRMRQGPGSLLVVMPRVSGSPT